MSSPEDGPVRVGDLVEHVLEDAGVGNQIRRQSVVDAWETIVGEKIADVTRAVRVDEAVLYVEVRSSAWLMELNLMKPTILERVNEGRDDGRIEKVRFLLAENG